MSKFVDKKDSKWIIYLLTHSCYVNTKLRDEYSSLDKMCDDLDIDRTELERKLGEAGFEYSSENNKFF